MGDEFMMKPIAICRNDKIFTHYTSWTPRLIQYCADNNINYKIVNCYSNDIIEKLDDYSALIWNYSNFVISDILEARNIMKVAENKHLITFPSGNDGWHFDDKIAQMYALKSVDASIPESWVFYSKDDCIQWLGDSAIYPVVAKLRCGSGSNNVKLIKNKKQAIKYAKKMFSKGLDPMPSLRYKAYSKLQSATDISVIISRIKKIPQFLYTRNHAKMMPIEKGYCYFQKFIKNDGYDLKVVVVNDKLTFCARNIRKNDFRASGGGSIYYDKTLITDQIIDESFNVADKLNLKCVGFDFVVDNDTGFGKIVEMCYGFDYSAQEDLGGYFDRDHVWHDGAVVAPDEIIKIICKEVQKQNEDSADR